ncbi:MAG: hypothetical protein M1838_001218 [Thelocarpon superellum]|nr:MAG: hypothetical protein M1838_001218 [Thelocarpon superellum]
MPGSGRDAPPPYINRSGAIVEPIPDPRGKRVYRSRQGIGRVATGRAKLSEETAKAQAKPTVGGGQVKRGASTPKTSSAAQARSLRPATLPSKTKSMVKARSLAQSVESSVVRDATPRSVAPGSAHAAAREYDERRRLEQGLTEEERAERRRARNAALFAAQEADRRRATEEADRRAREELAAQAEAALTAAAPIATVGVEEAVGGEEMGDDDEDDPLATRRRYSHDVDREPAKAEDPAKLRIVVRTGPHTSEEHRYPGTVDWTSGASIKALNRWRQQIFRRKLGAKRTSFVPFEVEEKDFLIEAHRRAPKAIDWQHLAVEFNARFHGTILPSAPGVPRPWRTENSLSSQRNRIPEIDALRRTTTRQAEKEAKERNRAKRLGLEAATRERQRKTKDDGAADDKGNEKGEGYDENETEEE